MPERLDDVELETYARQIVLADIGYEGQLRLRGARVCLVGLGGLGSPSALKLTGMGVGLLRIVDRDVVSRSDLHRQYLYDTLAEGRPKVEAAVERLERLNPDVVLEAVAESVTSRSVDGIVEGMDVVVDGLDRPEPRYLVNRACVRSGVPYVYGAAVESYGSASTIVPGRSACLECFMGGLGSADLPVCGTAGVHPSALAVISAVQVSEAVRLLTGKRPHLEGKLFYADLRSFEFTTMELGPSRDCPVCAPAPGTAPRAVEESDVEESCARDGKRSFFLSPRARMAVPLADLKALLERRGLAVLSSGPFGVTFETPSRWRVCILASGGAHCAVPPGAKGDPRGEFLGLCRSLLVTGLGLPASALPE